MSKFPNLMGTFVYVRTYSRFLDEAGRRETWDETVSRYQDFMMRRVPESKKFEFKRACEAILNLDVMPSMRALWTAGPALERENVAAFNCTMLALDHPKAFSEMLYLLMNGCGVGFSVERQFDNKLPDVPTLSASDKVVQVADSKEGWARAYAELLRYLWLGIVPTWDLSRVRPRGARLKTFGGRASGPGPLDELFKFTVACFKAAQGRKLNSVEAHRIACKTAEIVVVGGVRRSATISLSNPSDDRMRNLKQGAFWETMPELAMANNSACWTEKPDAEIFMQEWLSLIRSKSGERGIFNRQGSQFVAGLNGRRNPNQDFLCNPCSEVIGQSMSACNLSEVIIRAEDDLPTLQRKVRQAMILGVVQSTLTNFKFLRRDWKRNLEEERLCGVSLTGLRDHPVLGRTSNEARLWLQAMRMTAIETATEWANALEINVPAATCCVKPSGTVSSMVDTSAGLHTRFSPYYIRRVRVSTTDPLAPFLVDAGVPHHPEAGQTMEDAKTLVFEFPIKSPDPSVCRDETTAMEQLEYWLMLQQHWCDALKPSCTIYVKDDEWMEVGAWVYKNWQWVSGISFLPFDGGVYQLMPYEECSESEYLARVAAMPAIDFTRLSQYECEDNTQGSQERACSAGGCDLT